ncbi:two component transcriptional regulator, LuxR family [Aliiroseovarius crassostreae]|uniref:LuxR family transcriptional regulator n=1 Tax=Aliiroseovarius crassostreae TaxID=154981 RepID=A0A0P7IUY4_9RHOB|nr:response regulator transcription factor [Aliiroseovarius crassostreae]KPN62849.1 LuxR family transcriptional regulator [Aliiroseovarius crassostreae]SFU71936.1 two component transcriptional regulator, LuxR family [Aliiroseovarius crassostreae]
MTIVLIVDDHHLIRAGAKNLLEGAFSGMRVEGTETVSDALAFLGAENTVDLVLLDVHLPDSDAIDGLIRLKQFDPSNAVALISGHTDYDLIRVALEAGADGFIPKSADPQVLIHAVSLILEGEIFLPRSYLQGGMTAETPVPLDVSERPEQSLTPRQRDVFELMCKGLANKEIARLLDLSESTIKSHVSAIFKQIGTTSRLKTVANFRQEGAVPPSVSED